jgi:death-on-curing protein
LSEQEVEYLALADVIAIHQWIMERMGAAPAPFRAGGEGHLESAVMRPQMAAHYEDADLIRQAALLAISFSQAQAFLDGNKRTAFAAIRAFLGRNGLTFRASSLDVARQLEMVAERGDSLDAATEGFESWLRASVARIG